MRLRCSLWEKTPVKISDVKTIDAGSKLQFASSRNSKASNVCTYQLSRTSITKSETKWNQEQKSKQKLYLSVLISVLVRVEKSTRRMQPQSRSNVPYTADTTVAHRSQRKALSASLDRPLGQRVCGASRRGAPVNGRRVRRL